MQETRITIIGAGVVGLAVAYELSKSMPNIIVLEKNDSFGRETSSRNSEVIHAGLYYPPGSLKAKMCIRGKQLLYSLCSKYNISHKKPGKIVLAGDESEVKEIEALFDNAGRCGVRNLEFISGPDVKKLEPDTRAVKGFLSPDSGIIDSHRLMKFFYHQAKQAGVVFAFSTQVIGIDRQSPRYEIAVKEGQDSFSFLSNAVINCAGLYSGQVAAMAGIVDDAYKLHYCKGQYFRIKNPKKFSVQRLIYPPATDVSLGIHITPDLGAGLRLGPDAEYVSQIDYNVNEDARHVFYESVNKFLPTLQAEDLIADTAGIRPKLQGPGQRFRDFVINEESARGLPGFTNLIGIESPGLTACLAIAEYVKTFFHSRCVITHRE